MTPATYQKERNAILADYGTPDWVKDTLRMADTKDALDALRGLEQLSELFALKWKEISGR